jgi:hypothetical protein
MFMFGADIRTAGSASMVISLVWFYLACGVTGALTAYPAVVEASALPAR